MEPDLAALSAVTLPFLLAAAVITVVGLLGICWRQPAKPPPARWVVVVPFRYQPARIVYEDVSQVRIFPEIEEFDD